MFKTKEPKEKVEEVCLLCHGTKIYDEEECPACKKTEDKE